MSAADGGRLNVQHKIVWPSYSIVIIAFFLGALVATVMRGGPRVVEPYPDCVVRRYDRCIAHDFTPEVCRPEAEWICRREMPPVKESP